MAADLFRDDEDDVIASINIIPFVDIVLVLLIIFMLTSAAIVSASVQVDLPSAASAGAGVQSTVNVVFTAQRELFLNGNPTTEDRLAAFIRRQADADPKLQAVIAADERAPYGDVIGIIDIVKLNGVKAFALNIERKTGSDG